MQEVRKSGRQVTTSDDAQRARRKGVRTLVGPMRCSLKKLLTILLLNVPFHLPIWVALGAAAEKPIK